MWTNFQPLPNKLIHGWFSQTNQSELKTLIEKHKVKSILEIGSWLGLSTIFFAESAEKVYCVDTWAGGETHKSGQHGVSINGLDFVSSLKLLKDQFLTNLYDYRDKVSPMQMDSRNLDTVELPKIDLIYIDGEHTKEMVYSDISKSIRFLQGKGIVCGDDYESGWPGVVEAVNKFTKENNLKLNTITPFWWFEIDLTPSEISNPSETA